MHACKWACVLTAGEKQMEIVARFSLLDAYSTSRCAVTGRCTPFPCVLRVGDAPTHLRLILPCRFTSYRSESGSGWGAR